MWTVAVNHANNFHEKVAGRFTAANFTLFQAAQFEQIAMEF